MIILKKIFLRYKHPNRYKAYLHLRLIIGIKLQKEKKDQNLKLYTQK